MCLPIVTNLKPISYNAYTGQFHVTDATALHDPYGWNDYLTWSEGPIRHYTQGRHVTRFPWRHPCV